MRVTGGIFKGIRLQAPLAPARATTDRMRQAIFSSISELVCDAEVLDLFAGCGSLGIEAVSRGAKRATFVENAKSSWKVLEENLRRLGIGDRVRVCKEDVGKFLEETARRGEKWDLVFADPPYFTGHVRECERDFASGLLSDLNLQACLRHGGFVVLETRANWVYCGSEIPWVARVSGRRHGDSAFHVFQIRP